MKLEYFPNIERSWLKEMAASIFFIKSKYRGHFYYEDVNVFMHVDLIYRIYAPLKVCLETGRCSI